jgi:hypothetical protein
MSWSGVYTLVQDIFVVVFVCFCRKSNPRSVAWYLGTPPLGWHALARRERRFVHDNLGHSLLELDTFPSLILITAYLIRG